MLYILFPLLCISCQKLPPSPWKTYDHPTSKTNIPCRRVVHPTQNQGSGIDVEIIAPRVYLNVHSLPIETGTPIVVIIDEQEHLYTPISFAGGQRFQLQPSDAQHIVEALSTGKTIEIHLGRYSEIIHADGYSSALRSS